jgi:hypothetical protein
MTLRSEKRSDVLTLDPLDFSTFFLTFISRLASQIIGLAKIPSILMASFYHIMPVACQNQYQLKLKCGLPYRLVSEPHPPLLPAIRNHAQVVNHGLRPSRCVYFHPTKSDALPSQASYADFKLRYHHVSFVKLGKKQIL